MDVLRPWLGVGLGIMLMLNGFRWLRKPESFVGVGPIPATDPRTVRIFGIAIFVLGAVNALLNLSQFLPE